MRPQKEPSFDPTSAYTREHIEGFTVLVNPKVLSHKKEYIEVRRELGSQLKKIVHVMPEKPLGALMKVRVWVEWENGDKEAPVFHSSAMWLEEHGYNPDKASGIELSNTRKFIEWSLAEQPWLLLHELSHAYYYLVLGEGHKGVEGAYHKAVDQGLYECVSDINGNKTNAYALNNEREYYAELSEAYFGKNDFYPFTRSDLAKHDPVGYQLMEETWGKPRA